MTAPAAMQGVLDEMVAGAGARKRGAAAEVGLTPVGTEKNGPLDGKHAVPFPFDDPQTIVTAVRHGLKLVAETSTELDHIRAGLVALGVLYGVVEGEAPTPLPVTPAQKREEAVHAGIDPEPDASEFDKMMAEKSAAAQAATFKPFAEPKPEAVAGDAGWQCPTHGTAALVTLTSREGRKYRACREGRCALYEKGQVTS
jgi:hypothetical protein